MSDQFKDYVTGTSFALTLSRRMIEMLCQMDAYGYSYGLTGTARSLSERGLVEWVDRDKVSTGEYCDFRKFALTEAGRAVIPLLRLAGLYIEYPVYEAVEQPPIEISIRRRDDAALSKEPKP